MDVLIERIEKIELKIRRLVQKMELLKKENETLKSENLRLNEELDQQVSVNKSLNEKLAMTGAGAAIASKDSGQIAGIKKELDIYIKELDSCIHLMEQN